MGHVREMKGNSFSQTDLLLAERQFYPNTGVSTESVRPADTWFATFHNTRKLKAYVDAGEELGSLLPFPIEYFSAVCEQNKEHMHVVMTTRFPGDATWMNRVITRQLYRYGLDDVRFSLSPLQKPPRASLLYIYRQSVGPITHWTARNVIPTLENKQNALGVYSVDAVSRPGVEDTMAAITDGCTPALLSYYNPEAVRIHKDELFANRACYTNLSHYVPVLVIPTTQDQTLLSAFMSRLPGDDPGHFIHVRTGNEDDHDNYNLQPFAVSYFHGLDSEHSLAEMMEFVNDEQYETTISKIVCVDEDVIASTDWPEGVNVAQTPDEINQVINYLFDRL
jgi:hypothetical protein